MENNNRVFVIMIFGVLLIASVYFGLNYFLASNELGKIQSFQAKVELNQKVLNFSSMFIHEVLDAEKEVGFETRLSLENAVRDLKDPVILSEWQNFTNSKTEKEAQDSVRRLLALLIDKIQKIQK